MFYSTVSDSQFVSRGVIGTLRRNGFEWSETLGISAPAITSGFTSSGVEKAYHGDKDGKIYNHNTGNSFLTVQVLRQNINRLIMITVT